MRVAVIGTGIASNAAAQRARHGGVAAIGLRAAVGHVEDHHGDPLGSTAAMAEGRTAGASFESCRQYRLGDREKQGL